MSGKTSSNNHNIHLVLWGIKTFGMALTCKIIWYWQPLPYNSLNIKHNINKNGWSNNYLIRACLTVLSISCTIIRVKGLE